MAATLPAGTTHHRPWPALDGLRGSAILAVLLCHLSSLLPQSSLVAGILVQGWAGVDLFFVLSGFLITGALLEAKGGPNYLRNFYARRMLRIFPLYFGFCTGLLMTNSPGIGLRLGCRISAAVDRVFVVGFETQGDAATDFARNARRTWTMKLRDLTKSLEIQVDLNRRHSTSL